MLTQKEADRLYNRVVIRERKTYTEYVELYHAADGTRGERRNGIILGTVIPDPHERAHTHRVHEIPYADDAEAYAKGRNGDINQKGLEVVFMENTYLPRNVVRLTPINSKGKATDACYLDIPVKDLPKLEETIKFIRQQAGI